MVRITLYLPQTRRACLRSLQIAPLANFAPAPLGDAWLALGDSITQGEYGHHPSLTYAAVAARELGLTLHNCGVGGDIFDAATLTERPAPDPLLITVGYGTNDWNGGGDVAAAGAYLVRLRELYPATPVVVLPPIWREPDGMDGAQPTPNSAGQTLAEYRAALGDVVRAFPGMTYLPAEYLFPPGLPFTVDGLHPNTQGYIVYGLNLARLLRPVVDRLQGCAADSEKARSA